MSAPQFLARGLSLRCPNCGKGRIFRTTFSADDACRACGRVFQKDRGDWTGGMEMTVLLVFPFSIGLLFALQSWTGLSAIAQLVLILGIVVAVLPFLYRHVKGFWLGILRVWEGSVPKENPLQEPQWFKEVWEGDGRGSSRKDDARVVTLRPLAREDPRLRGGFREPGSERGGSSDPEE